MFEMIALLVNGIPGIVLFRAGLKAKKELEKLKESIASGECEEPDEKRLRELKFSYICHSAIGAALFIYLNWIGFAISVIWL